MNREQMRILFLAHRLPYPPNKGDKIRSFRALQLLSERHEVDLFCFYDDRQDAKYVRGLQEYCRHIYASPYLGALVASERQFLHQWDARSPLASSVRSQCSKEFRTV